MALQALRESGFVAVPDLARKFAVSEMTIRRDLDELARLGGVSRTYGGAALDDFVTADFDLHEPSVETRVPLNRAAKTSIATKALDYVAPGETIALDIGTTCYEFALVLKVPRVRVFTCSLRSATALQQAGVTTYIPGGQLYGTEPSVVGPHAIKHLSGFRFDTAFVGVSGVSADGLFDYSLEDAEVKRVLIANAQQKVVLADSSKFDHASVAMVATPEAIDVLITDRPPPPHLRDVLHAAGVQVVVAAGAPDRREEG
jgi:DeoR family glycerol-3-phosphate regulon repressor